MEFKALRRPLYPLAGTLFVGGLLGGLCPGGVANAVGPDDLFASAANYAANNPAQIVNADFNGDGHLDVVTGTNNRSIQVLLGDGTGALGPAVGYNANLDQADSVAVGDFAGDSNLDILVGGYRYTGDDYIGAVQVFVGNGSGTFTAGTRTDLGGFTGSVFDTSLASGDFNGDGNPDAVITSERSDQAAVLLNNGAGGFTPQILTTGGDPVAVAVGDVDGDTDLDIATANYGSTTASVFLNDDVTPGNFGAATNYGTAAGQLLGVALADLDGDGDADMQLTSRSAGVNVLLGAGDGTFGAAALYSRPGSTGPAGISTGDVNGDSLVDVIVTSRNLISAAFVYLGNGDGTLDLPTAIYPLLNHSQFVTVGDLNGDLKLDIVSSISGEDQVAVLLNTTPMTLTQVGDSLRLTPQPGSTFGSTVKYTVQYNTPARVAAGKPWGIWANNWPADQLGIDLAATQTKAGCQSTGGAGVLCTRPRVIGEPTPGSTYVFRLFAFNGTTWGPATSDLGTQVTVTRPVPG